MLEENSVQKEEEYIGTDGVAYSEVEWNSEVIVGGPTRREIESYKKEHGPIYYYKHDSNVFVFRTITRSEYKMLNEKEEEELMEDVGQSRRLMIMSKEDEFSSICTLYPENYKELLESGEIPAGIPATLSDMIYEKSGFSEVSVPIKL